MQLLGFLIGALAAGAQAASTSNVTKFTSFAQNLGLSAANTRALAARYAKADDSVAILNVACLTAQGVLGAANVDTSPLNQTIVDVNWSESCFAEPHCIIQPEVAQDVSTAVKVIGFFQVKFAVRSGGHSPNPGWSSIGSQGILIDLSKLSSVSLSSDGKVASVGPGLRWGEVTEALNPEKAVVLGGRLPSVGVGGLILGGGYHHLSTRYGLAADNVHNFEVVLSNGTIVDANAEQNNDLFRALKGGGPNFGIVSRYDLNTVPVYEVWAEMRYYSTDQAPAVLDAFTEWQLNGASDVKSVVAIDISLTSIVIGLVYSEPAVKPSAFAPFYDLEPLSIPVPGMNTTFVVIDELLASAFPTAKARHDYRGCSTRINANLTRDVYDYWVEKAQAAYQATGVNQTFALQYVGENLIQKGIENGGNALNIPSGPQQWWTTIVDWENEADDEAARSVSIETTKYWKKLAKERGLDVSLTYMNDASRDQNPLESYGATSLKQLKATSKKYDPTQMLQRLQNNGFLLSKA
ncbi:CAZyme family AA7 [Penicillium roqueforti]|nr:CAZyme family AA7 [Penicillium roqueforti]KAI2680007.1 CAZyme family AA7 [Penicillium roqueforti]KAI2725179.1 CAZyme family AA7 [Penicillium roqueforti]KAI2733876.1 CAZyme family AA7 [Penicillium roqueforti]KAI2763806.1 CAZyme family AA7 [Penicillium roqueforti]